MADFKGEYGSTYQIKVWDTGDKEIVDQEMTRIEALKQGITPRMLDEADAARDNAGTFDKVSFGPDAFGDPKGGGRGYYDVQLVNTFPKVLGEFLPGVGTKAIKAAAPVTRDKDGLRLDYVNREGEVETPEMPVTRQGWDKSPLLDETRDMSPEKAKEHVERRMAEMEGARDKAKALEIDTETMEYYDINEPGTRHPISPTRNARRHEIQLLEERGGEGINKRWYSIAVPPIRDNPGLDEYIEDVSMPLGGGYWTSGVTSRHPLGSSSAGEPLSVTTATSFPGATLKSGDKVDEFMTPGDSFYGGMGDVLRRVTYANGDVKWYVGLPTSTIRHGSPSHMELVDAVYQNKVTFGRVWDIDYEAFVAMDKASQESYILRKWFERHRRLTVERLSGNLYGQLGEADFDTRNVMWSVDLKGAGYKEAIREGATTRPIKLMSANWVGGGLLGGVGGAMVEADTADERGVNIMGGFAAGAGLVGLGPKMAAMVASQSQLGRKALGKAQTASDKAKAARAKSPTMGATDEKAIEDLGPTSAVAQAAEQMAPTGKPTPKFPEEDRLLTPLERIRQGVTRDVLSLEKLDKVAGKDKRVAVAAGQARGFVMMAEPYLQEVLGPLVKEHADHLDLAAYLAHAERRIEIHDLLGDDKVTAEQLFHANEVIAELANHPDIAKIKAAKDGLQDFYAQLLEMKHKSGILSDKQYAAIKESGAKYVPFLPEDLVTRSDSPFTTIADIYQFQSGTGVRSMSDRVNEAVLVNPWEQAIRDTYETFRRVQKQNLTNVITGLIDEEPKLLGQYVKKLGKRKPKGEPKVGMYVSALREGEKVWYHVMDPDLVASWSSVNKKIQEIGFTRLANSMRNFMQSGVTLNPVFAMRNGIRDFFMSAVQTRLNEGVPVLGWIPPELQVAGAGAAGFATAEEGSELSNIAAGAALLGTTHLAAHSLRVGSALMDILGPHNIGTAAGGLAGYWSASDDDSLGEIMGRTVTGAMLGRTGGAVAGLTGLRGRADSLKDFYKAGGGQFGLYSATKEDATRMLDDLIKSGVDPGDIIRPEGVGDAIRLIFQPINALLICPRPQRVYGRQQQVL